MKRAEPYIDDAIMNITGLPGYWQAISAVKHCNQAVQDCIA